MSAFVVFCLMNAKFANMIAIYGIIIVPVYIWVGLN